MSQFFRVAIPGALPVVRLCCSPTSLGQARLKQPPLFTPFHHSLRPQRRGPNRLPSARAEDALRCRSFCGRDRGGSLSFARAAPASRFAAYAFSPACHLSAALAVEARCEPACCDRARGWAAHGAFGDPIGSRVRCVAAEAMRLYARIDPGAGLGRLPSHERLDDALDLVARDGGARRTVQPRRNFRLWDSQRV